MSAALEYGRLQSDDDATRLARALASAFNSTVDEVHRWWDYAGREHLRVVRGDGQTVGGLLMVPMGQVFGGRAVGMTGIAGVAVSPESRGRGAARFMMAEGLREMHASGRSLSTLYASNAPLYRSVGYEQAGSQFRARVRLRDLPRERAPGRVRPMTEADEVTVRELHRSRGPLAPGSLERGSYIWHRIKNPRFGKLSRGFLIEGERGAEGYAYLITDPGDPSFEVLGLGDWCATTPEALRTLVSFLADHATMWTSVTWTTGPRDALLASVPDFGYELQLVEYWMLRVVDVPRALEARGYPPGLEAEIQLEVEDEVVAANRGRFVLSVSGGRGTVRAGGKGAIALGVAPLASLYSGHLTAEDLALLGQAAGGAAELANATAVFASAPPATPDFF